MTQGDSAARRSEWIVRRWWRCERWRIGASLHLFHGHGLADFEFTFKLGFPRHSRRLVEELKESLSDA